MTTESILDVIYYRCCGYALKGDIRNAKIFFDILQSEFKIPENTVLVQRYIDQEKFEELKLIKKQIDAGKIIEEFELFEPAEQDISLSDTEIEEEFEIVKHLYKNLHKLEKFLGSNLLVKGIESATGKNGQDRCDFLVIDEEKTIFPIEFKLKKATHAVVGQIQKYCLHYKLGLIQKTYKRVQGVVIANSYSEFAINELRKRGHICLLHKGRLNDLKISKI